MDQRHDPPSDPLPRPEPRSTPGYISPKLRAKLEQAEPEGEWQPKTSSPLPMLLTIGLILVLAVGGFFGYRAMKGRSALSQAAADSARRAAIADSLASVAAQESLATAARDTSSAGASTPSGSATGATASAGATASRTTPPPSGSAVAARTPASTPSAPRTSAVARADSAERVSSRSTSSGFGILVGSYLSEDRANSERTRLTGETGLTGVVHSSSDGMYEVILGKFGSRSLAERRAGTLVEAGKLTQAQVVSRP